MAASHSVAGEDVENGGDEKADAGRYKNRVEHVATLSVRRGLGALGALGSPLNSLPPHINSRLTGPTRNIGGI
jgi:hypothetical protein